MEFLKEIEEKWQKEWEEAKIFEADPNPEKKKLFVTFPFPYINGPIHVGHTFTASRVDAYARFKRMQGYNVLFPWAWHWTGQPLIGASQRVVKGDDKFLKVLREVDGVPEKQLEKFVDPTYMAEYYTRESKSAAKKSGFSVDWRREFHTVMPTFQKFIEWQYTTLKEEGYVTKGTHPVVWCPHDQSPTGDHDRQEGEGVTPEEYTLIKFKLDQETYLPAATFRPETIYGATNIWIHPDAMYLEARVDDQKWVISEKAAEKLEEQLRNVKTIRRLEGRELIGKTIENPVTQDRLPILPGWFVDPDHATGVVYSVPAHAPYDWLALKDLQEKPDKLEHWDIAPEKVKSIEPISIIHTEGFGEYPAVEIAQEMNIEDQYDPKAEEATEKVYKKEFHNGVLKENCGEYSGKRVQVAKDILIEDFKQAGIADSMYDLPQSVVCRCMTPCIVKVLQDQWFLKYSDPEWKKEVKKAIDMMDIYPEEAAPWFLAVIDWLKEWACARRTGLGTPLPWSEGWIIETLSDSTIYMAFYTINKHLKKWNIQQEMLTREVFDYIFYGEVTPEEVAQDSGIESEKLEKMRREFLYWYPVDLRVSAKELVPNHLSFFIFQHVALFPPEHWPKSIGVNGMLMIEGKQMHKSKGNFIPANKAIENYGADATRCGLMLSAEDMDDPNWRSENIRELQNKLRSFYNFAESMIQTEEDREIGHLGNWLHSTLQHRIKEVTQNLEKLKTRTALEIALFKIWNDFRWYLNRRGESGVKIPQKALEIWLKLLAPFAPHICEELWSKTEEDTFISLSKWPQINQELVNFKAEEKEILIKNSIEDTSNILKATKITPQEVYYYTASPWKWKVYLTVLEKTRDGTAEMNEVMSELSTEEDLKGRLSEVAKFAQKIIQETKKMPGKRIERLLEIGKLNEKEIIKEAKDFLEDRFRTSITVYRADEMKIYDPKSRAKLAMPRRPAIYIQ
ncbi:MAG: leucine--tRNA ligase [Thermoproteota archaeon]